MGPIYQSPFPLSKQQDKSFERRQDEHGYPCCAGRSDWLRKAYGYLQGMDAGGAGAGAGAD